MEIKSISQKIFRTNANRAEVSNNQTNPFGVSFKGNIISADVFETPEKANIAFRGAELAAKVGSRCKMLTSAITGSIGNMSSAISTRLNSVVDFGKRIGDRAAKAWNYLNTTNLVINIDTVKRGKDLFNLRLGNPYANKSVTELASMLDSRIAERASA